MKLNLTQLIIINLAQSSKMTFLKDEKALKSIYDQLEHQNEKIKSNTEKDMKKYPRDKALS